MIRILVRAVILAAISSGSGWKWLRSEKLKGNGNAAQAEGDGRISGEAGIGIEDFVAGIDERHHGQEEGDFAAGSEDDVVGGDIEIARVVEIAGDGLAQGGDPGTAQ